MQYPRGDDLVPIVAASQQLRDLERVQNERRVIARAALAGVASRSVLERSSRDR